MKFIITEITKEEGQTVTRECVDRVKGVLYIEKLCGKVNRTGEPIEVHFEGNYDLKITYK